MILAALIRKGMDFVRAPFTVDVGILPRELC
jgi:hypothetical protein